MTSVSLAAYLTLFAGVAAAFLFGALLVGRFFRPHSPNATKQEPYECGEPAVGSGFLQFDLRFYVVALVFIIFEVEVAFFFPWAAVFGKTARLASPGASPAAIEAAGEDFGLPPDAAAKLAEDGPATEAAMRGLSRAAMVDIAAFFGVLLVGFAYLWGQGDLDWVRAVRAPQAMLAGGEPSSRGDDAL